MRAFTSRQEARIVGPPLLTLLAAVASVAGLAGVGEPAHAGEATAVINPVDHRVAKTGDAAVNFPVGGPVVNPVNAAGTGTGTGAGTDTDAVTGADTGALNDARSGADNAVDNDEPNHWRIAFSPYTRHWRYNAEHRHVWAIAIERVLPDSWFVGTSFFKNSFGQPSNYVYVGRKHEGMLGVAPLFVAWSGGLMYGYTGKYQSKVPLNLGGYSPALLLSAGWQFDRRTSTQLNLLGDAAVMWQFNYAWR